LLYRDARLSPDGFRGAGEAGRSQALAEVCCGGGGHFQGGGEELGVATAGDVVGHFADQVASLRGSARAEADPGQRLLVQGHAQHVPLLRVNGERLLQHLRGAVEVTRIGLQLADVGQGRGEPHVTAELAGDGGALLQQGPRGVEVVEMMVGDAEAVEFSCLLVPVAEVTPDRQAPLEQRQRGPRLALLLQQHPEPVRQLGQRCPALLGGQVDGPLQPPPPFGDVGMPVPEQGQRLDQPQADGGPFAVAGRRVRGRGLQ